MKRVIQRSSKCVIPRRFASAKATSSLRRAEPNIKEIIENKQVYEESIKRRCTNRLEPLQYIVENREKQQDIFKEIEGLKRKRAEYSNESMRRKKGGNEHKLSISDDDLVKELKEIKGKLKDLSSLNDSLTSRIYDSWDEIPNTLDSSVPVDPNEGEIVEYINFKANEDIKTLTPNKEFDHKTIVDKMGIADFNKASRVSGFSWYYLLGDGALLEQALIQYGLSKARKHGYKMITPPTLVKKEIVEACGFKPKGTNEAKHIYDIENQDLSLTGTAEIPLGAFHSNEELEGSLPKKYVGISRAFRAEAGARGADTKGLYRVHEFNKVELFHFTTAENSKQELEDLKEFQTEVIKELGIKAVMINMPSSDLGNPAMKKYDCEAWMPGRGAFGELTSSSNCGDYQSRRLGIKYRPSHNEKLQHAHTLNGTCIAVPRVIIAIIEQNFDIETKSIRIPEVLKPWMDGKDRIYPQEGSEYAITKN